MTAILKTHAKIILAFTALALIIGGSFYYKISSAFVAPSSVPIFSPTNPGTDDVAGLADANYDIYYTPRFNGSLNTITVTFPTGYNIASGVINPATAMRSSGGDAGLICVNDCESTVEVASMTGNNFGDKIGGTITIVFGSDVTTDSLDNRSFSFSIIQGITNPETAGEKSAGGFTVSNNVNSDAPSPNDPVTIIGTGVADHFIFSQEPSGPTSHGQDSISGTAFDTQPIVEAVDEFGNLVDTYTGNVVLLVASGNGQVVAKIGGGFGGFGACIGAGPGQIDHGSIIVALSGGIADFTSKGVAYNASLDHESFTLKAQEGCTVSTGLTPATTSELTSDVVADYLAWMQVPDGCVSGSACTTQGIIQAQSLGSYDFSNTISGLATDTDYAGDISFSSTGAGTIVVTNPQSMTAGVLNTVGLGYNLVDITLSEVIDFLADSGSLTEGSTADLGLSGSGISISSIPPSVSLASNSGFVTQSSPISVTAIFSEEVTGFSSGDISITNGTAENFVAVSGTVYTFDVVPTEFGNVRISIAADMAQNTSDNGNTASGQLTVAYQKKGGVGGGLNPNVNEIPGYVPPPILQTPPAPLTPPVSGQAGQAPKAPIANNASKIKSPFAGNKYFQFHDRGLAVGNLQKSIIEINGTDAAKALALVGPTNYFGKLTLFAVQAFQSIYNIPATGFVGPLTIAKLNQLLGL